MASEQNLQRVNSQSGLGAIIRINGLLLLAATNVAIAKWIWPTDPKWWGLGFIAIILCFAAIGFVVDALKLMAGRHRQQKEIEAIRKVGNQPRSARFASDEEMSKAGIK